MNKVRKVSNHEFVVSNTRLAIKSTLLKLECGHYANWSRDEHDASNLPVEAECPTCGDIEANYSQLKTAIDNHRISHTRARSHYDTMGNVIYYTVDIYERNSNSPTGVYLLMSVADIPEYADLLRDRLSPLSPTER